MSSSTEIFSKRRKIYSLWRKTRVEWLSLARIQAYMVPLGGKYWWVVAMECTSVVYGNWVLMNIISDIIWCDDIEDCTDRSQLCQHNMYRRAENFLLDENLTQPCITELQPCITNFHPSGKDRYRVYTMIKHETKIWDMWRFHPWAKDKEISGYAVHTCIVSTDIKILVGCTYQQYTNKWRH